MAATQCARTAINEVRIQASVWQSFFSAPATQYFHSPLTSVLILYGQSYLLASRTIGISMKLLGVEYLDRTIPDISYCGVVIVGSPPSIRIKVDRVRFAIYGHLSGPPLRVKSGVAVETDSLGPVVSGLQK